MPIKWQRLSNWIKGDLTICFLQKPTSNLETEVITKGSKEIMSC